MDNSVYEITGAMRQVFQEVMLLIIFNKNNDYVEANLTRHPSQINGYCAMKIAEELGYEVGEVLSNGWALDYAIVCSNDRGLPEFVIKGCGLTGELFITTYEY